MALLLGAISSQARAEATRPVPPCALKHWHSNAALDLQKLQGKVVYVDFWASWCTPCTQSFPFLNTLEQELGDRGFMVVGVNLDENRSDATRFLEKNPAGFTIASNTDMRCPKAFGVAGMPAAYLIDRKGNIRHEHLGFRGGQAASLRALAEQLLGE